MASKGNFPAELTVRNWYGFEASSDGDVTCHSGVHPCVTAWTRNESRRKLIHAIAPEKFAYRDGLL